MTKRRVLVVGPVPEPVGGIATYVANQVAYYSTYPGLSLYHLNTALGVRVRGPMRYPVSLWLVFNFIGLCLIRRPYVVHLHTSSYSAFWEKGLMSLLGRLLGARTVIHLHGGAFDKFVTGLPVRLRGLVRYLLRRADRVIVLSEGWRDYVASALEIEPNKFDVVPNGVLVQRRMADRKVNGPGEESVDPATIVTFLGSVVRRKGILDLIEAIRLCKEQAPSLRFLVKVAGPFDEMPPESLLTLTQERGIASEFEFLGPIVSVEEKRRLLEGSAIFVLPSYIEGLPISLLEAMAAGLPVVSTRVGAVPEVITDGVNGYLIEPGNPVALAERLLVLAKAPELRVKMGRANHDLALERYSLQDQLNRLIRIYDLID